MEQVFLLNDLLPQNECCDRVPELFEEVMVNFIKLKKEKPLDIKNTILTAEEPCKTLIGGKDLKQLILNIENHELKSAVCALFLHGQVLSENYNISEWPEETIEDLLNLKTENGTSATNVGIACVSGWKLLSIPLTTDFVKDKLCFQGTSQEYDVYNFYGYNMNSIVNEILGNSTTFDALKLKLRYCIDGYTISLTPGFETLLSSRTFEECLHMVARLKLAYEKKCLLGEYLDENLLRSCTCTGDKHMFELKSSHTFGLRFYLKIYDKNAIVFSLIGQKADYGDKSKKKGGNTAQNKDMLKAAELANKFIENNKL